MEARHQWNQLKKQQLKEEVVVEQLHVRNWEIFQSNLLALHHLPLPQRPKENERKMPEHNYKTKQAFH